MVVVRKIVRIPLEVELLRNMQRECDIRLCTLVALIEERCRGYDPLHEKIDAILGSLDSPWAGNRSKPVKRGPRIPIGELTKGASKRGKPGA